MHIVRLLHISCLPLAKQLEMQLETYEEVFVTNVKKQKEQKKAKVFNENKN